MAGDAIIEEAIRMEPQRLARDRAVWQARMEEHPTLWYRLRGYISRFLSACEDD